MPCTVLVTYIVAVGYRRRELQIREAPVTSASVLLPYRIREGPLIQMSLFPVNSRVERRLVWPQIGIVQAVHTLRQFLIQFRLFHRLLPALPLFALRLHRGVVLHQIRLVREVHRLITGHGTQGSVAGHIDGFLDVFLFLLVLLHGRRGNDDRRHRHHGRRNGTSWNQHFSSGSVGECISCGERNQPCKICRPV